MRALSDPCGTLKEKARTISTVMDSTMIGATVGVIKEMTGEIVGVMKDTVRIVDGVMMDMAGMTVGVIKEVEATTVGVTMELEVTTVGVIKEMAGIIVGVTTEMAGTAVGEMKEAIIGAATKTVVITGWEIMGKTVGVIMNTEETTVGKDGILLKVKMKTEDCGLKLLPL